MHGRHLLLLTSLSALLLGALACATAPATLPTPASTAEPTAADQQPRSNDPSRAPSDDGAMLLIDPGAEPRAPLRFHLRVGDVARWKMVVEFDTTVNLLGQDRVTQLEMQFDAQTEVVAFDEVAREHHYESTILSAQLVGGSVDPAAAQAAMAPYIGLVSWLRADARGRPLEYHYTRDGAPVDPSTIAGLDDNLPTMAFPEEPVGIGARWQEFDEVERNGFVVLQTSEHHLVDRDGDHLEIATTVSQQPLSSTIEGPGMPAGTRAELRYFTSTGLGTSTHDLGRPIPLATSVAVAGSLGALIVSGEERAEMTMQLRVGSRLDLLP